MEHLQEELVNILSSTTLRNILLVLTTSITIYGAFRTVEHSIVKVINKTHIEKLFSPRIDNIKDGIVEKGVVILTYFLCVNIFSFSIALTINQSSIFYLVIILAATLSFFVFLFSSILFAIIFFTKKFHSNKRIKNYTTKIKAGFMKVPGLNKINTLFSTRTRSLRVLVIFNLLSILLIGMYLTVRFYYDHIIDDNFTVENLPSVFSSFLSNLLLYILIFTFYPIIFTAIQSKLTLSNSYRLQIVEENLNELLKDLVVLYRIDSNKVILTTPQDFKEKQEGTYSKIVMYDENENRIYDFTLIND
ncbi:hypothetical protein F9U64_14420 [Gracilibacillus oryzae]|uniref:Uncharacterized protein n=1 Tax=Gracilibacillus oryzae TaxID=1672701 RepID=A0A7C8GSB7_9BACI|nr:hypothetical protein [Gracilibacillus oryzae]KAB8130315.1 hypothetical protein F9U64_14420 [Gracilibacillus oryzae]